MRIVTPWLWLVAARRERFREHRRGRRAVGVPSCTRPTTSASTIDQLDHDQREGSVRPGPQLSLGTGGGAGGCSP